MGETKFIKDWAELGISGLRSGENLRRCPVCSDERKKKNATPLSINFEKGVGYCNHCETKFLIAKFEKKEYKKPDKWINNTALSDKLIKWFESRGISQETLIRAKVTESKRKFNDGVEYGCIEFNYFKNNELFNIKYRNAKKEFQLFPGAELNFYNIDSIKDEKECIIVEGEIDCLSYIESTKYNVVSVPNGANNKLDYLDRSYDYFEKKEKIYIAVDNDEKGKLLRDNLVLRLDPDKCYLVDFKDCKDANEYLIKYGKTELFLTIENAKPVPIDNVITIDDIMDDIDDLYKNGLQRGLLIGLPSIDKLISFESSRLCVITGIPTHGKSELLDFIAESMAIKHGIKFGVYSPENYPIKYHFSKLAEKVIGRKFSGVGRMDETELELAKEFINNHFYFITPDTNFTLESILQKAKQLILRHGINALIIDPWNKIQKNDSSKTETLQVQEMLNTLTLFKQRYNLHIFIVAHPRKMEKEKDTMKYKVPTLYDISSSSEFYNQADYGISVYRDWVSGMISMYVQKVKFKHLGEEGVAELGYNINNGRFSEWGNIINWDNSNHLIQTQEEIKINFEKFTPTQVIEEEEVIVLTEAPF